MVARPLARARLRRTGDAPRCPVSLVSAVCPWSSPRCRPKDMSDTLTRFASQAVTPPPQKHGNEHKYNASLPAPP